MDAKWLSWEKVKSEYDECSELLAIFSSIGRKHAYPVNTGKYFSVVFAYTY